MSEQKRISEWLTTAGKPSPKKPQFPENDKFQLGLKLILEELIEAAMSGTEEQTEEFLMDAEYEIVQAHRKILKDGGKEKSDLNELRDACADMRVVLGNLIHFAGMSEQYEEDFNEVMDSNFSKFCNSEEEADKTVEAYAKGEHPNKMGEKIECYHEKSGDYWIVKRKKDDKILKSINFVDANFKKV
jgi:NTP pyrophosphatase (non-canonical NTP hydrolase)